MELRSIDLSQRLVRHFDEPFGDSSAIPTYLVSEFAARHVKVCAHRRRRDELFAGYESFPIVQRLARWDSMPQPVRKVLETAAKMLPRSAYGKNYLYMISRPTAVERYFQSNYAPYLMRQELLQADWMLPADGAFMNRVFMNNILPDGTDVLSQAMYF